MFTNETMEYEGLYDLFLNYTVGSVSDRVCEAIRLAIIDHILRPGERLVEAKIAKTLHVSITPVRHAFAQLSKEGLIDVYPYRGTNVKVLTKQFIQEVCQLRALLEREAAKTAYDHFSEKDIETLKKQIDALCRRSDSFHCIHEACRADTQFHNLIFDRSGNQTLIQFWEILRIRMEYITSFSKLRADSELQRKRHIVLIEDLYNKDKEKFLADIYSHSINANVDFLEN